MIAAIFLHPLNLFGLFYMEASERESVNLLKWYVSGDVSIAHAIIFHNIIISHNVYSKAIFWNVSFPKLHSDQSPELKLFGSGKLTVFSLWIHFVWNIFSLWSQSRRMTVGGRSIAPLTVMQKCYWWGAQAGWGPLLGYDTAEAATSRVADGEILTLATDNVAGADYNAAPVQGLLQGSFT